jgi:hypothetical protein
MRMEIVVAGKTGAGTNHNAHILEERNSASRVTIPKTIPGNLLHALPFTIAMRIYSRLYEVTLGAIFITFDVFREKSRSHQDPAPCSVPLPRLPWIRLCRRYDYFRA